MREVRLSMTEKQKNDLFYLCALIEYTARKTYNRRGEVTKALGKKGICKQLRDAEVNHCLSFDQVSDEIIDFYKINQGNFDTISDCKYAVPDFQDIGKLYCIIKFFIRCLLSESKLFGSFLQGGISAGVKLNSEIALNHYILQTVKIQ